MRPLSCYTLEILTNLEFTEFKKGQLIFIIFKECHEDMKSASNDDDDQILHFNFTDQIWTDIKSAQLSHRL